jgi:hypothetical protein
MKQLFLSLLLVGVFVLGSAVTAQAQTVNFDACDAGDPCTEKWKPEPPLPPAEATITLSPGCIIKVKYQFRNCTPVSQFRILSYSVIRDVFNNSTCDFLGAQTVLQLIEFNLIQNAFVDPSVPNCPAPGSQIVQFVVASCVYEAECVFTYLTDPEVVCDPPSAEQPGDKMLRSWIRRTHLPCGTTCCKRTYEVCNSINPEDGQIYRNIKRLPTSNSGCPIPPYTGATRACTPLCD